jgi:hypothetical protein
MAMFFLLGLCTPGKSNIAYVYLLELVPTKWQTYVGTSLLIADGSTMILLSLYFRFITRDWLGFQIFGLALTTFSFVGSLIAPESPKYLYSYKRFAEAREALGRIARLNRVPLEKRRFKFTFDTEAEEQEKNRKSIPILSSSWNQNSNEITEEESGSKAKQSVMDQINRSEDRTPFNESGAQSPYIVDKRSLLTKDE